MYLFTVPGIWWRQWLLWHYNGVDLHISVRCARYLVFGEDSDFCSTIMELTCMYLFTVPGIWWRQWLLWHCNGVDLYVSFHCARYLVFDSDEEAEGRLSQTEIAQAVDVTSAAKVCVCFCACVCVCDWFVYVYVCVCVCMHNLCQCVVMQAMWACISPQVMQSVWTHVSPEATQTCVSPSSNANNMNMRLTSSNANDVNMHLTSSNANDVNMRLTSSSANNVNVCFTSSNASSCECVSHLK